MSSQLGLYAYSLQPRKRNYTISINVTLTTKEDVFVEEYDTLHTVSAIDEKQAMQKLRAHYKAKSNATEIYAIAKNYVNPHI